MYLHIMLCTIYLTQTTNITLKTLRSRGWRLSFYNSTMLEDRIFFLNYHIKHLTNHTEHTELDKDYFRTKFPRQTDTSIQTVGGWPKIQSWIIKNSSHVTPSPSRASFIIIRIISKYLLSFKHYLVFLTLSWYNVVFHRIGAKIKLQVVMDRMRTYTWKDKK